MDVDSKEAQVIIAMREGEKAREAIWKYATNFSSTSPEEYLEIEE